MPNTITVTAARANTVKPIEYRHPNTLQYQDSNILTGVAAGVYTDITCRLKGSNPPIISVWNQAVTVLGPGLSKPVAPTVDGNDTTNMLVFAHPTLPDSEIVVSVNGGVYAPYTGPINVGNVARAVGYWKAKIKATSVHLESDPTDSPLFTFASANITPDAPTSPLVNDTANTFDWTANPTYSALSEYETTVDGGTTAVQASAKPLNVGNVAKAAGLVGVRVKAATGRNVSPWTFNQQAFTATVVEPNYNTTLIGNGTVQQQQADGISFVGAGAGTLNFDSKVTSGQYLNLQIVYQGVTYYTDFATEFTGFPYKFKVGSTFFTGTFPSVDAIVNY